MYRYEIHCHTSEGSACAYSTGAEMAQFYHDQGYDGLVVTDHFYHGNTAVPRDLPWDEWVARFCRGYEGAKARGDEIGLSVFFGWEYSFYNSDFLTYGLGPEWLLQHPDLIHWSIEDYLDRARAAGAAIVHAHPFREAPYVSKMVLIPWRIDAVEVFNGGNRNEADNCRAAWFAAQYGLGETSGSDSHHVGWPRLGGIAVETPFQDCTDLANRIRAKEKFSLIRPEISENT